MRHLPGGRTSAVMMCPAAVYRTAMALTEDRPFRIEIVNAGVMIRAGRVASPARIGRAWALGST